MITIPTHIKNKIKKDGVEPITEHFGIFLCEHDDLGSITLDQPNEKLYCVVSLKTPRSFIFGNHNKQTAINECNKLERANYEKMKMLRESTH